MKPTVYVVDDDSSVREALSSLVRSVGLRVMLFSSAHEFLRHPRDASTPGCLVLDVRLPGMTGLELQGELRRFADGIPIIFITGHGDIPMSVRAMKAGAVEFLQKPFREEELLEAIRASLERDERALSLRGEASEVRARYETLTAREREVFAGAVTGKLNKQIALELGISETTVKAHRGRIMEKLEARTLGELIQAAHKLGLA